MPRLELSPYRGRTPTVLSCDVLVVGGGLAGAWAAIGAAEDGARVALLDKGYVGTSGVTAAAGPGHWWVAPKDRDAAVSDRLARGLGLADPDWMHRILAETWTRLPTLARYYRFPVDDQGETQYRSLRGPEYLKALRAYALDLGVRILDHSPVLELLADTDQAVAGGMALRRQTGDLLQVQAAGTVLATGGCAFLSRLHGSCNNTGDGHLMAAEAGASFASMEFCNYYVPSAAGLANNRSMLYSFGRFFDADGVEFAAGPEGSDTLLRALLKGPVRCTLDRTPQDIRDIMHRVQPNWILPFVRAGIDPYRDCFEVTAHGEGTIRGTGGVQVVDARCATSVEGLFVAGDVATRDLVAGAISGGGAINSSFALTSGLAAGQAAARRRSPVAAGRDDLRPLGRAGLRPARTARRVDRRSLAGVARDEMNPLDKNVFRHGAKLAVSLEAVSGALREISDHDAGDDDPVRAREAAALNAAARWCIASALSREETRGQHRRLDHPDTLAGPVSRIVSHGLDTVVARAVPVGGGRP